MVFSRWGTPQAMKFDNGAPFASPDRQSIPALSLWLVGLGIKVVWNRPRMPQDNAKVERIQGMSLSWSGARTAQDLESLRERLRAVCTFQRETYPSRVCANRPRLQKYPRLLDGGQRFRPEAFDLAKVRDFLAQGVWERNVSRTGQINLHGRRWSVGRKYQNMQLSITYNREGNCWECRDNKGNIAQTLPALFDAESIINLTAFATPPKT